MNLILFDHGETVVPLPRSDGRALHLLEVLRRRESDTFDAGLIDGPRGKGTLVAIGHDALTLAFTWGELPPALAPITLVVGLPRPQSARKILNELAALGVHAMHFVATERGEASYAQSNLWSSGEWRRHLIAGAEQAFCTRLPEVTWARPMSEVLGLLPVAAARIALDNYESPQSLAIVPLATPLVLALGAERGWTGAEREVVGDNYF